MTNSDEQRWNLVFSGQLLPGTDKERAKRTLAAFFGLRDVTGVAVFFSGKPVPLRRNITRNDAQRLYQQLRSVGLICEIFSADTPEPAVAKPSKPSKAPPRQETTAPETSDTALDAPSEVKTATAAVASKGTSPGKAPNLFALRPAQNPQSATQVREGAQIRSLIAAGAALALGVLVLAVALRFPSAPAGKEPLGPLAGTTLVGNELVLMVEASLLLHARSGLPERRIAASALGFERLAPPLWAMPNGDILLNAAPTGAELRLQRCDLNQLSCYTFSPDARPSQVTAIASSLLGDSVFLLGANGELWRSNTAGEIESETIVQVPWGQARVIANGGLLQIPAGDGPLLGVYRPDTRDFGQQLDALLIMPPAAVASAQDRLRDVALGDTHSWALMAGDEASAGLFRFDQQWGNPTLITLPTSLDEPFLISWRDKLLVADTKQAELQRVASDGTVEAPFTSPLLVEERESWLRVARQRSLLRKFGIGLPVVLIILCAATALLYFASYRFLGTRSEQSSALLDPMPGGIVWLKPSSKRDGAVTQLGFGLTASAVFILILASILGGWQQLLAASPYAIASFYAWNMLRLGRGGHLGLLKEHVIIVDYDGRYFYGERSLIRGNASMLFAPGAALPLSPRALPNINTADFAPKQYLSHSDSPFVEFLGALWLSQHPWMRALLAICVGTVLSFSLLIIIG